MTSVAAARRPTRTPHPWAMLAVGVLAQASGTLVVSTPAFLLPLLHRERGIPLAQAGLLAAAPNLGLVLTLVLWGWLADRAGERLVLVAGLALTTAAVVTAAVVADTAPDGYVVLGLLLVLAGAGTGSVNAASGRMVVGWFPRERRGLAMGIRQSCQPLGVAAAAIAVPPLVAGGSVVPALALGAVLVGLSAVLCLLVVVDPPRTPPTTSTGSVTVPANPYRAAVLWRIHGVSALLVVPQFALSTFGLVWLIDDQGWSALAAGVLVAVAQFAGALGRVAVGVLSDRVGSRLRPLRWVAWAGIALLLATAGAGVLAWPPVVAVTYVLATCVSVADNGLAFTAVAEFAGPYWSGRALGAQNTGQFLAAAVVGPGVGALIALVGYPLAFALVAIAPAVATPLVPSAQLEHDRT